MEGHNFSTAKWYGGTSTYLQNRKTQTIPTILVQSSTTHNFHRGLQSELLAKELGVRGNKDTNLKLSCNREQQKISFGGDRLANSAIC